MAWEFLTCETGHWLGKDGEVYSVRENKDVCGEMMELKSMPKHDAS